MFDGAVMQAIERVARELGVEPAALAAVVEVESGGRVYAIVEGRPEPLIRFEGHYFDRRLSGAARERARREGLASPKAGAVANPTSQAARWALLSRAASIDRVAAWESVSWGVGQVMGAHWAWLGYASVDALVAGARDGIAGQMRLMARFIDRSGLARALRTRDWPAFARGYNGPTATTVMTAGWGAPMPVTRGPQHPPSPCGAAAKARRCARCRPRSPRWATRFAPTARSDR